MKEKKVFRMYLNDAQMAQLHDTYGIKSHVVEVPIGSGRVLKYIALTKVPREKNHHLILTPWQKRAMKDEIGHSCDTLEIKKGHFVEYGVSHDER